MKTKKKNLLFALSIVLALSFHSVMASTNLVQNSGFESGTADWPIAQGTFKITAANGPSATGTASALLDPNTTGGAEITQQIATIPGTNYIVQFDYKTLDGSNAAQGYTQVVVSDTNNDALLNLTFQQGQLTTTFQTAVGAFTALGNSETIQVGGFDKAVVDNVIVSSGSYSEPGRYTGSVKVSSTIPLQSVGSFHTESVAARVSPSGGLYIIKQPSGAIEDGGFANENTLAISGTTATVTVRDKTDIKFTVITTTLTGPQNDIPVINTEAFSLRKVGK